jgi:DNA-binding XRE family transcriptional regulator
MPPARVQELVAQMKAWYESHSMLQKELAAQLGVSPTGLCQIFAGVNQPSASTTLEMLEFLDDKNMTTTIPKTLTDAREQLEEAHKEINGLNAEVARLKLGAPVIPTKTAPIPTAPPPRVAVKTTTPTGTRNTGMIFNKPTGELSKIDALRVRLNEAKDDQTRTALYKEIKAFEAEQRI